MIYRETFLIKMYQYSRAFFHNYTFVSVDETNFCKGYKRAPSTYMYSFLSFLI